MWDVHRPPVASRSVQFRLWWVLALVGLSTTQTYAAQVLDVQVTRDSARFLIGMHIVIDGAAPEVFLALQDYAAMPRYNHDLRAVRIEATSEPNRVRLFTTAHTCVLLFCKTVHQEQIMTATADASGGILEADLVPEHGAFEGHGRWTVGPCGAQRSPTCMDLRIELLPVFWVPPVIGPWLIRRKMYEEAQRSSVGLEQMVQDSLKR
jgi:hypothetical protein